MKKRAFAVPSLIAAGLALDGSPVESAIEPTDDLSNSPKRSLISIVGATDAYTMAAHRSHSSHGSHGSHRSSSGGGYRTAVPRAPSPSRVYTPPATRLISPTTRNPRTTPNTSILPSSPALTRKPKPLKGNTVQFIELLKKLQIGLQAFGYYNGAIDGIMGPQLKVAISKYQADSGYKVTGTVTPEMQSAFGLVVK